LIDLGNNSVIITTFKIVIIEKGLSLETMVSGGQSTLSTPLVKNVEKNGD